MAVHGGDRATAFAPGSVGNLGVGFDILGQAVSGLGDTVTVARSERRGVRVLDVGGSRLPLEPGRNTASRSLLRLSELPGVDFGFDVSVNKGIPIASGIGGSAASAVAAVVAANALLPEPMEKEQLFPFAVAGEAAASGSTHPDNVAPSLFGGLVLVNLMTRPATIVPIPVPEPIHVVLVHPQLRVQTRSAREVLSTNITLKQHVQQSSHLAGLIAGCYRNDLDLIAKSLTDVIIEPQRRHMVAGFADVRAAAMEAGALGCSLSGAGPSVFAWCPDEASAQRASETMVAAFGEVGAPARSWFSSGNQPGARLLVDDT